MATCESCDNYSGYCVLEKECELRETCDESCDSYRSKKKYGKGENE